MFNDFRTITFFFSDSTIEARIADHAAQLARRYSAHLVGVFQLESEVAHYYARGEQAIRNLLDERNRKRDLLISQAHRRLERLQSNYGVNTECRVVSSTADLQQAAIHALHSDLVLVGHPSAGSLPERLILNGGAPVLLVPDSWEGTIGTRVVLGWNASHQARRAIGDAMPFISEAEKVRVLVINSEKYPERFGQDPGVDISHYLSRHTASVELDRISANDNSDASTIRAFALDAEADLIVIGAFSHARIGQMLFAGVTKELLTSPVVPLLLTC